MSITPKTVPAGETTMREELDATYTFPRQSMAIPTIVVSVMLPKLIAVIAPILWLAPMRRPVASIASPFVPASGYATDTTSLALTFKIREYGGCDWLLISDTYSASPNQTGPSTI